MGSHKETEKMYIVCFGHTFSQKLKAEKPYVENPSFHQVSILCNPSFISNIILFTPPLNLYTWQCILSDCQLTCVFFKLMWLNTWHLRNMAIVMHECLMTFTILFANTSVLARSSCKEGCLLKDQSIVVVLITFLQPH